MSDIDQIITIAKNYCEKKQIVFCDHHISMVRIVIKEAMKMGAKRLVEPLEETTYDMDIYKDQEPVKDHRL